MSSNNIMDLSKQIIIVADIMQTSVENAAKTRLWNYETAQALIPGRNAIYALEEVAKKILEVVDCSGSARVGDLLHSDTFTYGGNAYMRVCNRIESGSGTPPHVGHLTNQNLNTKDACLVLKLSNSKISYFNRSTKVKEVNLNVEIINK